MAIKLEKRLLRKTCLACAKISVVFVLLLLFLLCHNSTAKHLVPCYNWGDLFTCTGLMQKKERVAYITSSFPAQNKEEMPCVNTHSNEHHVLKEESSQIDKDVGMLPVPFRKNEKEESIAPAQLDPPIRQKATPEEDCCQPCFDVVTKDTEEDYCRQPELDIGTKATESAHSCRYKYSPYIEVGARKTIYSGQKTNGAIIYDFFVPIFSPSKNHLVFTDIRIFNQTGGSFGGNVQLGYRHLITAPEKSLEETKQIIGIHGSLDRMRSEHGKYFNQVTLGGEYWRNQWFIGGNIYMSLGMKRELIGESQSSYQNSIYSYTTSNKTYEETARGIDGEVGYSFTENITGYLGGFYFKGEKTKAIKGISAKLDYTFYPTSENGFFKIFDQAKIGVGVRETIAEGFSGFVELKIRLGLSHSCKHNLPFFEQHMVDLIRRESHIVTKEYNALPEVVRKKLIPVPKANPDNLSVAFHEPNRPIKNRAPDPEISFTVPFEPSVYVQEPEAKPDNLNAVPVKIDTRSETKVEAEGLRVEEKPAEIGSIRVEEKPE